MLILLRSCKYIKYHCFEIVLTQCVYLQQDEVLAGLKEYVCGIPVPRDAPKVELTIRYLTALNNLFERSLLGKHVRVFEVQGSTIQRMQSGYQFFVDWAKKQEPNGDPSKFLAWQVYECKVCGYTPFLSLGTFLLARNLVQST